jgi:thiamine-monophosphate kinase
LVGKANSRLQECVDRFLTPVPKLAEGEYLASVLRPRPTSTIDLSDGLLGGLSELAAASGTGFRIRKAAVPVARGAVELARLTGDDSWESMISGGEDYELLFTVRAAAGSGGRRLSVHLGQLGATPIGEVTATKEEILLEDETGSVTRLGSRGYQHFA